MKQLSQRSFRVSGRRRAPTVADLLTIAVLLSLVVFLATWMPRQGAATLALVQYAGGERQVRLDIEQSFELSGPLGPTTVRVSHQAIRRRRFNCVVVWSSTAASPARRPNSRSATSQPKRCRVQTCCPDVASQPHRPNIVDTPVALEIDEWRIAVGRNADL